MPARRRGRFTGLRGVPRSAGRSSASRARRDEGMDRSSLRSSCLRHRPGQCPIKRPRVKAAIAATVGLLLMRCISGPSGNRCAVRATAPRSRTIQPIARPGTPAKSNVGSQRLTLVPRPGAESTRSQPPDWAAKSLSFDSPPLGTGALPLVLGNCAPSTCNSQGKAISPALVIASSKRKCPFSPSAGATTRNTMRPMGGASARACSTSRNNASSSASGSTHQGGHCESTCKTTASRRSKACQSRSANEQRKGNTSTRTGTSTGRPAFASASAKRNNASETVSYMENHFGKALQEPSSDHHPLTLSGLMSCCCECCFVCGKKTWGVAGRVV